AAAFVGELIGLRPIISFIDGETKIVEKVRGDKNIVPSLLKLAQKSMIPHTPYCVLYGSIDDYGQELAMEMEKKVGYKPVMNCNIGAAISINAGHKIVAVVVKGSKRR
ncbi:MAG: hypothetical protein K0R90_504, partial [Oscillospiraceae bacterium]|nr:hypothetical protein [Oscillospiraceae bacterium]